MEDPLARINLFNPQPLSQEAAVTAKVRPNGLLRPMGPLRSLCLGVQVVNKASFPPFPPLFSPLTTLPELCKSVGEGGILLVCP